MILSGIVIFLFIYPPVTGGKKAISSLLLIFVSKEQYVLFTAIIIKSLFTKEQLQDLRKEFVKFKLADMTSEDLFQYIRDIMMNELIDLEEDELRDEIDEYDEYLYEVLAPYVLDQEGSYEVMQEFIHDRQEEW